MEGPKINTENKKQSLDEFKRLIDVSKQEKEAEENALSDEVESLTPKEINERMDDILYSKTEIKKLDVEKSIWMKQTHSQEMTKEGDKLKLKEPKEVVDEFVNEYGLADHTAEEFKNLSLGQQLYVVQNLKKRIVDIVKSKAETEYSEFLKEKGGGIVGRKLRGALNKGMDMQELEGKVFKKLHDVNEGRELISDDLKLLMNSAKEQTIYVDRENNTAKVVYLTPEKDTPEGREPIYKFNQAANKFREMPYEWGQEGKTFWKEGNRRKYEKAKKEYENARGEILNIKSAEKNEEEKIEMMIEMKEVDNKVENDQLIGRHPEYEKELEKIAKEPSRMEWAKRALEKSLSEVGLSNKVIMALGFDARKMAKGAAITSGLTITTAVASAAIGATIGSVRGGFRSMETLKQRKKDSRYGKKDQSAEASNSVDIENLTKRLEAMTIAVENATSEKERLERLDQLNRRVNYTKRKINEGLVNFGEVTKTLGNQFNLANSMNKAILETNAQQDTIRKDIDERLDRLLTHKERKIDKAEVKFIKKQMLKGAMIGAGFATFGYALRWIYEGLGHVSTSAVPLKEELKTEDFGQDPYKEEPPQIPEEDSSAIESSDETLDDPPKEDSPVVETDDKTLSDETLDDVPKEDSPVVETDDKIPVKEEIPKENIDTEKIDEKTDLKEPINKEEAKTVKGYYETKGYYMAGEEKTDIPDDIEPPKDTTVDHPIDESTKTVDDDYKQPGENQEEIKPIEDSYKESTKDYSHSVDDDYEESKYDQKIEDQTTKTVDDTYEESEKKEGVGKVNDNYEDPTKNPETIASKDNHYNLPKNDLVEVRKVYENNIEHIFFEDINQWEEMKNNPAIGMLDLDEETLEQGSVEDTHRAFFKYLYKLKKITGLEPRGETLTTPAETNAEYITRALQKAAKDKVLGQLKF